MAKSDKPKKPDQHRSPHLVRVDRDIFLVFKELAQEADRPMTREVRQAMIAWAKAKGKWPRAGSST